MQLPGCLRDKAICPRFHFPPFPLLKNTETPVAALDLEMEAIGRGQQVPSLILIHVHPESHPRMQDLVCFILNPGHIIESRKVFAPISMVPCLILASASPFPLPDLALLAASASLLNN